MRYWESGAADTGSYHCLGNGKIGVYEQGPNVMQVFGPPYSSPAFLQLHIEGENSLAAQSERMAGTGVWTHRVLSDGQSIGKITDFVDAEFPCFVRKIELQKPLALRLHAAEHAFTVQNTSRFPCDFSLLAYCEAGTHVYAKYPTPIRHYHQVCAIGVRTVFETRGIRLDCPAGTSYLFITGGPGYEDCILNMEEALNLSYCEMETRTVARWMEYTAKRRDFAQLIPASHPERDRILRAIDDTAIILKTQHAREGALVAGHMYLWTALRDMYGVYRGYMSMGYHAEAKRIIEYFRDIYKSRGIIHNGQDLGLNGFFHIHENDEVEMTGFLMLMIFDFYRYSRDDSFVRSLLDVLTWAYEAQKRHLHNNMLPFNGDETYIAGGVLPRSTINDGSCEATMLFIEAGEEFIDWLSTNRVWDENRLKENRELLANVRAAYRDNFLHDGKILTNNPGRLDKTEFPRFRHGVCEAHVCQAESCSFFGWTEKDTDNRYKCPACLEKHAQPPKENERFFLQSVSLMPLYIGSDLYRRGEICAMIDEIMVAYAKTGAFPSRPDGQTTVAYDYGLMLYNLTELNHPKAGEILVHMLDAIDDTGAWVEYYSDHKPRGCRYRPYESGINMAGLVRYIESLTKQ